MKKLFNFLHTLICSHKHVAFIRNLHGDEINQRNGKRSLWRCLDCDSEVAKSSLYDDAISENRHAQTLENTVKAIKVLKADEHFESMVSIANSVYAQFCLKEMQLDSLNGTFRGQRGIVKFESISQIESFIHDMEGKINDLNNKIRDHEGSAKRIQEVAKRLGVERFS